MTALTLTVNGDRVAADVEPRTSLADFLRGSCGLTGTHLGCEHGVCGACTVMIDGKPMRSCIAYAVQMQDRDIRTIESFDDDAVMAALRAEFSKQHALQCGFCTPGMLITARDIVTRLGNPGEARVREELAGNLCRCTGYAGIVQATQNVGDTMALRPPAAKPEPPPMPMPPPAAVALPVAPRAGEAPAPAPRPATDGGGTAITQSVVIPVAIERLWSFFRDLPAVASCIPGAVLTRADDETWEGGFEIKMGPIRARMNGAGSYVLHDADKHGVLQGSGVDALSGSRVSGTLDVRLAAADAQATTMTLTLTFALQGLLAQFSRSTIANEFVALVVREFAGNVAARLGAGGRAAAPASQLSVLRLMRWWIVSTARALFRRRR